jgi:peptidoglycan/xylan/chitin deacetylase (PgdA/CDA1 family)
MDLVPVLLYHSISDHPHDRIAVHPKLFLRHMEMLKSEFSVVSLQELNNLFRSNSSIPADAVAVSFDDGYDDAYTDALPILNKYSIPATFFIPAGRIGTNNDWNTRAFTRFNHLDTNQLAAILDSGHVVGSHGITHAYLPKLTDAEIEDEVCRSKEILERTLATDVPFISYPYGDPDQRVLRYSKKVYELGFRTDHGSYVDWSEGPSKLPGFLIMNECRKFKR